MPWVRLHGTQDYWGMAMHLLEVPEFHCTINLVPSLLAQIQRYTERNGSDRHLDVSRRPADDLAAQDALYLLENFFMANVDNMIRPYPRYFELYQRRGFGIDLPEKALRRFSPADLRDLQVWSNLTWFHELAFEQDAELADFRHKGRGWTETEKQWLLGKQLELLRQIIPLHQKLSDRGQVELTTTPFYHPILPLLWDMRSARQAMPGVPLPQYPESYREDAVEQIQRGVAFHKKLFGVEPRGMWPSEGSVSQEIIGAVAKAGIQWIATDEEILAHSTDGLVSRDPHGHLRRPEMLYRPWRVEEGEHSLQIAFRDHGLSDLIGFHYQRSDPVRAADDLLERVESIGRAVDSRIGDRPALVPIILDGENCWEYYPDGGVKFLRHLYQETARRKNVSSVRMYDYLEQYPATDRIPRLFAGSWISHNFAIWIGHREDNAAWDAVHETRVRLLAAEAAAELPAAQLRRAREELLIAEGSDWYWWFGDDHSSAQDALFDQLFRRHLQNVYTHLQEPIPPALFQPISRTGQRLTHTQPRGFSPVKVDGRQTFFEWIEAGVYEAGSQRGTMTLVTAGIIESLHFGFDVDRLLLRIDMAGTARGVLTGETAVEIGFLCPAATVVRITRWSDPQGPRVQLSRDGNPVKKVGATAAMDEIIEVAIPFSDLGVQPGDALHWFAEVIENGQSIDRAPSEGSIELVTPDKDFERIHWQV